MNKVITEYDKKGNRIYYKNSTTGYELWQEFDENNNRIHTKDSNNDEYWGKYDKNNNRIHYKNTDGTEEWYRYDENDNSTEITEKEFKQIERNKINKEKQELYLNNKRSSRFRLMDI